MDRRITWSIIFLLGIIVMGCQKSKTKIVKNEEGVILEVYEVNEDSLKNGKYIGFYENGDTFEVSNYNAGKLDGLRKIYTRGNVLEITEQYRNDSLHGKYQVYYNNGRVKLSMLYIDNVIRGKAIGYYENGSIKEEVTMDNNRENGPFVEYYKNGQKSWEGRYKNGENEVGLLIHFAENGDTIKKMMCDDRYICRTIYQNPEYSD